MIAHLQPQAALFRNLMEIGTIEFFIYKEFKPTGMFRPTCTMK